MKTLHINRENVSTIFNDTSLLISKNEFTILYFKEDNLLFDNFKDFIELSQKFEKLYYSISDSSFINNMGLIKQYDFLKVLSQTNLDEPKIKLSKKSYRDYHLSLKSDKRIDHILDKCSSVSFLFEVIPSEDNLDDLYASLLKIVKSGHSKILLNLKELSLDNESHITHINRIFELLSMYCFDYQFEILISENFNYFKTWRARLKNPFEGPSHFDIDVANTCTHNCVFCGLYSDAYLEEQKQMTGGDDISPELKTFMRSKIDTEDCFKLIEQINDSAQHITFGGAGDPYTHPDIQEFILKTRERGFLNTIYSNFAYMTKSTIKKIHDSTTNNPDSVHFIVNFSGGTPETYVKTRPNQREETFKKVVEGLRYSTELYKEDGKGITFKIMAVINKYNFEDLCNLALISKYTGALYLWCKPMELHGDSLKKFVIEKHQEEMTKYARSIEKLLVFADKIQLDLFERNVLEKILSDVIPENERKDKEDLYKEIVESFKENSYTQEILTKVDLESKNSMRRYDSYFMLLNNYKNHEIIDVIENKTKIISSTKSINEIKDIESPVQNADIPSHFFSQLSCQIGRLYVRVDVNGNILPCCISAYPVENIKNKTFWEVWRSASYDAFRKHVSSFPEHKSHLNHPEWVFCQQCCHMNLNTKRNEEAGFVLEITD